MIECPPVSDLLDLAAVPSSPLRKLSGLAACGAVGETIVGVPIEFEVATMVGAYALFSSSAHLDINLLAAKWTDKGLRLSFESEEDAILLKMAFDNPE